MTFTVYEDQYTVYEDQYTVYEDQYTVYEDQYTVYEDQYTRMYLSHIAQFFLECGMFQTKVIEELKKAHFVFSNFFFRKSCCF